MANTQTTDKCICNCLPLTDDELRVIENKINPQMRWRSSDEEGITLYPQEYFDLVRAIEAAHGIGEKE